MNKGLHDYICICNIELKTRDKTCVSILKWDYRRIPLPPCGESRGKQRGESQRRGAPRECSRKIKTFLGLVSNLQQLSSHQRKTAYGKGTVRGCLLKRITALKGSEAKQRYEFRCSCRVRRRVDLGGGDNTIEGAQALENTPGTYLSTHQSIHPSIAFIFLCLGKMRWSTLAVPLREVPKACIIPLAGSKQALFNTKRTSQHTKGFCLLVFHEIFYVIPWKGMHIKHAPPFL